MFVKHRSLKKCIEEIYIYAISVEKEQRGWSTKIFINRDKNQDKIIHKTRTFFTLLRPLKNVVLEYYQSEISLNR